MKSRIVKGLITFWILAVSHCWQLTNAETSRLELTEAAHFVPVAQNQQLYSKSAPPPAAASELSQWLAQLTPIGQDSDSQGQLVVVSKLLNTTQQTRWFVNPISPIAETVHLYFYEDQAQQSGTSGLHHMGDINLQQGNYIDIPTGVTGTLLLIFESQFTLVAPKIKLIAEHAVNDQVNSKSILMLLALGMLLALSIYNVFLFYASKELTYLYFTFCSAFLAFGWANIIGLLKLFFNPLPDLFLIPPFLLSAAFSILFTRAFLNLKTISGLLDSVLMASFWICIVVTPITAFLPLIGIFVAYASVSLVIVTSLIAGAIAWRRQYKPARFFIFAYSAFALQSILWSAAFLHPAIDTSVSIIFIGLLSSTTGCILLSLSLAAKVSLITMENRQFANNLEQKVYERTEALAEANVALEHLISELQEASSAKSHFLANMSHEIRTPLTAIIGYADGILEGDINREEQDRVLRVISQNGNHLLHIISDILDISKIEADKLEYEMLPCSIVEVLSQVESVIAHRARDKGLGFSLNYHFPIPSEVTTDPYRFKQILLNLTNNAVKFTEQGQVDIDINFTDPELVVTVKDTGIGMSQEKLNAIFDPFEQGGASVSRQFGGTGLGLSISRRLAIGLGGDISAHSSPQLGACFEVRIKACPTPQSTMLHSVSEFMESRNDATEPSAEMPDFSGNKILLVDDHPNNRDLIKIILKRMNVEVSEAEDGDSALQMVFENEYDLILMDIQMPRMRGDEATETLRKYGYTLPVIALTANNMKHEIEEYMRKGFTGHLAKPIVRQDFIATLTKHLRSQGSTDSLFSNDEMLPLVIDYHRDLIKQLDSFEHHWAQQELQEAGEIAHRIKGAAGSFGFALVGQKFADIEQLLKAGEQEKLNAVVPPSLKLARLCCELPGIEIPQAVARHDMDVELLLTELQAFVLRIDDEIAQLWACLTRGEFNIAKLYLNRITPRAKKFAWQPLWQLATEMEATIQAGQSDVSQVQAWQSQFETLIDSVKNRFVEAEF